MRAGKGSGSSNVSIGEVLFSCMRKILPFWLSVAQCENARMMLQSRSVPPFNAVVGVGLCLTQKCFSSPSDENKVFFRIGISDRHAP